MHSSLFHDQALVSKPDPRKEKKTTRRDLESKAECQQNLKARQKALDDEADLLAGLPLALALPLESCQNLQERLKGRKAVSSSSKGPRSAELRLSYCVPCLKFELWADYM